MTHFARNFESASVELVAERKRLRGRLLRGLILRENNLRQRADQQYGTAADHKLPDRS